MPGGRITGRDPKAVSIASIEQWILHTSIPDTSGPELMDGGEDFRFENWMKTTGTGILMKG